MTPITLALLVGFIFGALLGAASAFAGCWLWAWNAMAPHDTSALERYAERQRGEGVE